MLDPTVGSGAFLFAALNILEPLYEACIIRMEQFVEDLSPDAPKSKFSDFKKILSDIDKHPSRSYFIYKSIIINNLYGVDIMDEAVEICKLRLFLKLVAQVETSDKIEPLPDIDFNIRAGNTLVGFATHEEVEKAVTTKLDFDNNLGKIEEKAEDVKALYDVFLLAQMEEDESQPAFKEELRNKLNELNNTLNHYLAGEYGIDHNDNDKYRNWLITHHPFHWFVEFYGILNDGGFDVIIGNPPYVEYSKVKEEYTILNYKTEKCGNLYAFCVERSLSILCDKGKFSLIVPISIVGNIKFKELRKLLIKNRINWFSHFSGDTHPGTLFTGVQQNICIFINSNSLISKIFNTEFLRFLDSNNDRTSLFVNKLRYSESIEEMDNYIIYKIGKKQLKNIIGNIKNNSTYNFVKIDSLGHKIYYHDVVHYWFKSFMNPPYFKRERELQTVSSHYKTLYVSQDDRRILPVILSSSLYYIWYIICSNGRDVSKSNVTTFPFNIQEMTIRDYLESLGEKLIANYDKHKKRVTYNKKSGTVSYDQYWIEKSKSIIDEIDKVLAEYYGFTEEELDFIINYDIKYRMGKELNK